MFQSVAHFENQCHQADTASGFLFTTLAYTDDIDLFTTAREHNRVVRRAGALSHS
jgi:hypothetical protein